MFTPQRKGGWAGWSAFPKLGSRQENTSAVPRTNPSTVGAVLDWGKGATASEASPPLPPQSLLAENIADISDALYERVSALENEVRDHRSYQLLFVSCI
ncbi:hypothetical protein MA16_Dca026964 [Dendrobium catenatum]|uniref:Uncharacterized protein n=1 Tax=Dendrobium catenatum TaxID=906689 RepID=A0A2I0WRH4_9ASPA|nr:hypothetical protein MA16_Dca026964 [Dendrobium catenatum]